MRPHRLPAPLDAGAFRIRDALTAGVGEGRLRGADLSRPFHGVRSPAETDLEQAYAPLLRPNERFSHLSAARIWGAPLPRLESTVHVTLPHGPRARGRGVIGHESACGRRVVRSGLPVSDPTTLFLELATLVERDVLVAIGDHLALEPRVLDPRDERPYISTDELRAVAGGLSVSGSRAARAAAAMVRSRSESPMETRLRLLALAAGLPDPVLQFELRDAGGRIGWFDLAWPAKRLIAEYDGDQHRTSREQYERDIRRFERATDAGWRVLRIRAHGLLRDPDSTRDRLLRAWRVCR